MITDRSVADRQWFHDDEFDTPLPPALAEECARVYGRDEGSVDWAQGLAAFLAIPESRAILIEALCPPDLEPVVDDSEAIT